MNRINNFYKYMTTGFPEPSQLPEQPSHDIGAEGLVEEQKISSAEVFPRSLEYLVLISRDRGVFGQIFDCLKQGWEFLDNEEKMKLEKYTKDLLRAVKNYKERCEGLQSVAQMRMGDPEQMREAVQRSDQRRRDAHNSLIDALNILSRQMKEMEINNNWRANDAIYDPSSDGMREKISVWAQKLEFGFDVQI